MALPHPSPARPTPQLTIVPPAPRLNPRPRLLPTGTVYLLCADAPIGNLANPHGTARHYIGWTINLDRRIHQHRKAKPRLTKAGKRAKRGQKGARLCAAWNAAGITWRVARTWRGTRQLERQLKNRKKSRQLCPYCRGELDRATVPSWPLPWPGTASPDDLPY